MEAIELLEHLENLKECDPDYVVDVLGITSEQLIQAFFDRAVTFIKEDQG